MKVDYINFKNSFDYYQNLLNQKNLNEEEKISAQEKLNTIWNAANSRNYAQMEKLLGRIGNYITMCDKFNSMSPK